MNYTHILAYIARANVWHGVSGTNAGRDLHSVEFNIRVEQTPSGELSSHHP